METDHFWREEYRREVEMVLNEMRAEKGEGRAIPIVAGLADAVVPPLSVYQELQAAKQEAAQLKARFEELRGQLEAKAGHVEEELRRRNRLKDLVISLYAHMGVLEAAIQEARRTSGDSARRSQRYHEQGQLAAARLEEAVRRLASEKQRGLQARGLADTLQHAITQMRLDLDAKERACQALQARCDAAEKDFPERLRRYEARLSELEPELDEARRRLAGMDAREAAWERERRQLAQAEEAKLDKLGRLHHEALQQWESERQGLQGELAGRQDENEKLSSRLQEFAEDNQQLCRRATELQRDAGKLEEAATQAKERAAAAVAKAEAGAAKAEAELHDARQAQAAAEADAAALRREHERFQKWIEEERLRLQSEHEASREAIETQARGEIEDLRRRMRELLESRAADQTQQEHMRAEAQRERQHILEMTQAELHRPDGPAPQAQEDSGAPPDNPPPLDFNTP